MRKFWVIAAMLIGAAAVLCTGLCPEARGAVIGINPSADAFTVAGLPNNNYGGGGALAVYNPNTTPNGQYDTIIKFNLSSVKSFFDTAYGAGTWFVTSATLQLTGQMPQNGLFVPNAAGSFETKWMVDPNWTEGGGTPASQAMAGMGSITYTTLNSTYVSPSDESLGTFSYNGLMTASTYTLTPSAGFLNDIMNGSTASSLHVLPADTSIDYLFNSVSFTTPSARPVLTILAIPEPASITGMAMVGLLAWCKRRRHV